MKKQNFLIATLWLVIMVAGNAQPGQFKALLFTKTSGYHHKSIHSGVKAMKQLAEKHFFYLEWHENAAEITDAKLEKFDLVIFLNTSGDILDENQQKAMESFIQSGKGFVGIHGASATEYDWEWYGQLVGRFFHVHPTVQTGMVKVIDRDFPGLERLPTTFMWTDEWYEFGEENTSGLNYLLTVDEDSYDTKVRWAEKQGDGMGAFHPLSWYHEYDGGRAFYTALGHVPATFEDPLFLHHIYGGIYWAATGKGINKMTNE